MAGSRRVEITVVDRPTGALLPCKLTFQSSQEEPLWGDGQVGQWLDENTVALGNTILSLHCELSFELPPHVHAVTASRGIGYTSSSAAIDRDGERVATLRLSIEPVGTGTPSCADLHVHSAPSYDSEVPIDQRLISAAAEGLDFIVPSDHDVIGDWRGAVDGMGIEQPEVLVGIEVTPDQWESPVAVGHFNLFPVSPEFDARAYMTERDGESLVNRLRTIADGNALLQLNHPRFNEWIGYSWATGFDPDLAAAEAVSRFPFDTLEVYNGHELDKSSPGDVHDVLRDWFFLVNHGWSGTATGNSDTHRLARSPIGLPRTCAAAPITDATGLLDALRRGTVYVSNGPLLEATVEGSPPGEMVRASGPVSFQVRVAAADWVPVDTLSVWLDGELWHEEPLSLAGGQATITLEVPFEYDGWLVAMVSGATPLGIPAGQPARPMLPLAFTNPFYVDVDGGVWMPPGLQ